MVEAEYARAIYDLAQEENKVNLILDCFHAVNETLNKEFMDIMASPYIDKVEKKSIISRVINL